MSTDLDNLAKALNAAAKARSAEVAALADMSEQEIAYLASVGDLEDPVTDGIEGRCNL